MSDAECIVLRNSTLDALATWESGYGPRAIDYISDNYVPGQQRSAHIYTGRLS
jgi:hypothetical protein